MNDAAKPAIADKLARRRRRRRRRRERRPGLVRVGARTLVKTSAVACTLILVASCSLFDQDRDSQPKTSGSSSTAPSSVVVTPDKATSFTTAGLTVAVPAKTVNANTVMHVSTAPVASVRDALPELMQTALTSGTGTAWNVDLSGAQPAQPITVHGRLPAGVDADTALIVTVHDGVAQLLDVTTSADGTFTFQASELSEFWLTNFAKDQAVELWGEAVTAVLGALDTAGQRAGLKTVPACNEKPLTLPGAQTVTITPATDNIAGHPLSICLTGDSRTTLQATVNSHDPLPWRVHVDRGSVSSLNMSSLDDALLQQVYANLPLPHTEQDALLTAGGHLTLDIPATGQPTTVVATQSEGLYLANITTFAVAYLFDVFTFGGSRVAAAATTIGKVARAKAVIDCVNDAASTIKADSDNLSTQDQITLIKATVGCAPIIIKALGHELTQAVGVVLTSITDGLSLASGGFLGAFRAANGLTASGWRIIPQAVAAPPSTTSPSDVNVATTPDPGEGGDDASGVRGISVDQYCQVTYPGTLAARVDDSPQGWRCSVDRSTAFGASLSPVDLNAACAEQWGTSAYIYREELYGWRCH